MKLTTFFTVLKSLGFVAARFHQSAEPRTLAKRGWENGDMHWLQKPHTHPLPEEETKDWKWRACLIVIRTGCTTASITSARVHPPAPGDKRGESIVMHSKEYGPMRVYKDGSASYIVDGKWVDHPPAPHPWQKGEMFWRKERYSPYIPTAEERDWKRRSCVIALRTGCTEASITSAGIHPAGISGADHHGESVIMRTMPYGPMMVFKDGAARYVKAGEWTNLPPLPSAPYHIHEAGKLDEIPTENPKRPSSAGNPAWERKHHDDEFDFYRKNYPSKHGWQIGDMNWPQEPYAHTYSTKKTNEWKRRACDIANRAGCTEGSITSGVHPPLPGDKRGESVIMHSEDYGPMDVYENGSARYRKNGKWVDLPPASSDPNHVHGSGEPGDMEIDSPQHASSPAGSSGGQGDTNKNVHYSHRV